MMKTIPGYKRALKSATKKAVNDFETMLQQNWRKEDDETLNNGDKDYYEDDGEDDIYND